MKSAPAVARQPPSLADYTNFHGMLCRPTTAKRCVESFNGRILFMPNTYTPATIETFDCTRPVLSVVSYYALVLISLTGLSTLLKRTKFLSATEIKQKVSGKAVVSDFHKDLVAEDWVWNHVTAGAKEEEEGSLQLIRKFEYEFFGGLTVMMLHLVCKNERLHLVEVYRWRNRFLGSVFNWVITFTHHIFVKSIFAPQRQKFVGGG